MPSDVIGVYPGTFDPFTYGHLDIVNRALHIIDNLVVGVAQNTGKNTVFSLEERIDMVQEQLHKIPLPKGKTLQVLPIPNLLINFAKDVNAGVIIRGLRAVSDFDIEFKLCSMNRRLDDSIETMLIMTDEKYQFVSSSFVKEIVRLGGDISGFVPQEIELKLKTKYGV
jgi:pantetheine-phosphate adenylyltransferase